MTAFFTDKEIKKVKQFNIKNENNRENNIKMMLKIKSRKK